jgi:hypothetical protein
MEFRCDSIKNWVFGPLFRRRERLGKWNGYYAIWPRKVDKRCYVFHRLERRKNYFGKGNVLACVGWWEYRLPPKPNHYRKS